MASNSLPGSIINGEETRAFFKKEKKTRGREGEIIHAGVWRKRAVHTTFYSLTKYRQIHRITSILHKPLPSLHAQYRLELYNQ